MSLRNLIQMVCLAVLFTTASQTQAALINTVAQFGGTIQSFGETKTPTYGQTFTAPSDNVLNSFSLYLNGTVTNPLHFKAYVYAWDGVKATGSQLYQSSQQSYTGSVLGSPTEFAFSTGATQLSTGTKYVAFLNADFDGNASTTGMPISGSFTSNPYSGGEFVFLNNGNNFSLLTTKAWRTFSSADVWFKASFSDEVAVPEPASMVVWSIGALGMGLVARRRVRKAVTV